MPLQSNLNRILVSNSKVQNKLAKVHELTDDYFRWMLASLNPVCREGCSHCCHFPVPITRQEAKRLAEAMNRELTVPVVAPRDSAEPSPCPFLSNNRCTAYSFRPVACRSYFVLAADSQHSTTDCTKLASPEEYATADLRHTGVPPEVAGALNELEVAAPEQGQLADIRDWFPAAKASI